MTFGDGPCAYIYIDWQISIIFWVPKQPFFKYNFFIEKGTETAKGSASALPLTVENDT